MVLLPPCPWWAWTWRDFLGHYIFREETMRHRVLHGNKHIPRGVPLVRDANRTRLEQSFKMTAPLTANMIEGTDGRTYAGPLFSLS